jgi:large subunit ribosomal protein L7Ae
MAKDSKVSKKSVKGKKSGKSSKKDDKVAKKVNPLIKATPKFFGMTGSRTKRDLTRFVRWPRMVRVQRQRQVLYKRLKTPPSINQFTFTADANVAGRLFKLLGKIRPEDKKAKKERLAAVASGKASKATEKPIFVKSGLNHVTGLVESKKAKLVIIAHDVDPVELVVWLPALCRKMDVPYMIVKSKARLGSVVHQKTAAALAITDVAKGDQAELAALIEAAKDNYNNNDHCRKTWGIGVLGQKSQAVIRKREEAIRREQAKLK